MKRNSSRSEQDLTGRTVNNAAQSRRRKPPIKSRVGFFHHPSQPQHRQHQEVVNTRLSFSAMNINELQQPTVSYPQPISRRYCGSEQNMLDSRVSLYSIGLSACMCVCVDCVNQVSRLRVSLLVSTMCCVWNVSNPPYKPSLSLPLSCCCLT